MLPQDSRVPVIVVVIFGVLFFAQCSLACPDEALKLVQQCTYDVMPNLSSNSQQQRSTMDPVKNARDSCRDSRLRSVADCIQQIMDQCKGTTNQEQTLQRLIDKKRLMDTVDYFCRHLGVYETNAVCITDIHGEVNKCTQDAQESFENIMNAGASMDVLITGSCRFHGVARTCLTNNTIHYCGAEAGEFVFTLLTGHIPPYCDEIYESLGTGFTRTWSTERRGRTTNDDNSGSGLLVSNVFCMIMAWTLSRLC